MNRASSIIAVSLRGFVLPWAVMLCLSAFAQAGMMTSAEVADDAWSASESVPPPQEQPIGPEVQPVDTPFSSSMAGSGSGTATGTVVLGLLAPIAVTLPPLPRSFVTLLDCNRPDNPPPLSMLEPPDLQFE